MPIWGGEEVLAFNLFWYVGFLGLVLIIVQAVFGIAFGGHDHDFGSAAHVDAQGGHGSGAGYLSIRTISAMLLGFGFGGALLERNGFPVWLAAFGGIVIGVVIALLYVAMMRSLYRLRSDGTSVLSEAVNQSGTVYLRVPGLLSGAGEIQVAFGGRLQNVKAFTQGPELSTGTTVRGSPCMGDRPCWSKNSDSYSSSTFRVHYHYGHKLSFSRACGHTFQP